METLQIEEQQIEVTPVELEPAPRQPAFDIEAVRALARKAFPDSIPELISGDTFDEVMASVEGSRTAYARVYAEAAETHKAAKPPVVPAGGSTAPLVDVERLPTAEKVRRGIAGRRVGG